MSPPLQPKLANSMLDFSTWFTTMKNFHGSKDISDPSILYNFTPMANLTLLEERTVTLGSTLLIKLIMISNLRLKIWRIEATLSFLLIIKEEEEKSDVVIPLSSRSKMNKSYLMFSSYYKFQKPSYFCQSTR